MKRHFADLDNCDLVVKNYDKQVIIETRDICFNVESSLAFNPYKARKIAKALIAAAAAAEKGVK